MNRLKPADIFQSHMVLQRDKPVSIWGTAPEKSTVRVELTNSNHIRCVAQSAVQDGRWLCLLPARHVIAPEKYSLTVSCDAPDTASLTFTDISFGDIWLACGQSNMEFFLRYDEDWERVKHYKKNEQIYMYNVPQKAFEGHKKVTPGSAVWFKEQDPAWEVFSAPGYSFARHLQPALNIPIGIIGCNWGGTTAAAWLDETCLEEEPLSVYLKEYEAAVSAFSPEELEQKSKEGWLLEDSSAHDQSFIPVLYGISEEEQKQYVKDHKNDPVIPMGPWNINRPGGLYHNMLESLIPLSIKGVLWYQGESDASHADIYDQLFTALITCWRKAWKDDFPFLFVQLAPFEKWLECDACGYPMVRSKQELVSKTVPDTAMTSIMDLGMYYDIHPKKKMEVGRRLALLARGKVYGEQILCEPPEYKEYMREKNRIILTFANCNSALHTNSDMHTEESVNGFVLMQNDQEIPVTSVLLEGNKIILEAEALQPGPCTVLFAYSNYVEVNVWNEANLPVKPFILRIPD